MAIYLWLIAFVLGASPIQKQYKKIYLTFSLFFIWIIIAFRSFYIGSDTLVYTVAFPNLANSSLASYGTNLFSILFSNNRFEYGYVVFNKIIYYFTHNPRWLIIASTTIIVILMGYILYKYCEDPALALIIFITMGFMAGSMSQIRQYLAWAICFFSIKYIMQNKPIKFILTIVVAMLFHISAIVFLPMYWITKINFTFIKAMFLTIIILPTFTLFTQFSSFAKDLITTYENYNYQISNNGTNGHLSITINLVTFILFLLLAIYLDRTTKRSDKITNLSLWMIICGCLTLIFSYNFSQLTRLSIYFTCGIMFIFNKLNDENITLKNIIRISFIVLLVAEFIVINKLRPGWSEIVPYHFMASWWGY